MRTTSAIMGSAALRAPYTVTIAANPVRCRRPIGSLRNEECSHTPVRTAGSANSRMTAAIPPISSATGFLKMRQDSESGANNAASPGGRVKSIARPFCGFNRAQAAASSLRCKLNGSRMIELLGCIAHRPLEPPALHPLPGDQRRQAAQYFAQTLRHRDGERQFAADAERLPE